MKWLEIIELRKGSSKNQNLRQAFKQLIKELTLDISQPKVSIYNNCSIDSDYSVLLFHDQSQPNANGSVLGMQISAFLKNFGLVNHNILTELPNCESKSNN